MENNKQQSSIAWLMDKLKFIDKNAYNELYEYYEQAKAIHKEEIIKSWMAVNNELQRIAAEKYYNETFGKSK